MTTRVAVGVWAMPPRDKVDLATRQRIAAHLRRLKAEYEFESDADFARYLGLSRGALNRYLKGERTVGLDVLLTVHRKMHVSIDVLVDKDAGSKWSDPGLKGDDKPHRK